MQQGTPGRSSATLDAKEIDRFARLASEWWDPRGKFRALHKIGPARLGFLRDEMHRHFARGQAVTSSKSVCPFPTRGSTKFRR